MKNKRNAQNTSPFGSLLHSVSKAEMSSRGSLLPLAPCGTSVGLLQQGFSHLTQVY